MAENQGTLNISVAGDFSQLEKQLASVSNNARSINLRVNADNAPLGRISRDVKEFDRSLAAANARVIAFGGVTGVLFGVSAAFKELVSTTVTVGKQITTLNTLLGNTPTQFGRVRDEVAKIAGETGQSFTEVTEAAQEFAKQGLTTQEAFTRTKDAMILVRTTGIQVKEAIESITGVLDAFSNEALNSTEVINKLVNVGSSFSVGSAALTESIKRSAASAKEAGVSFDQLIAIITSLQQETGRGAGIISQGLRQIFQRLERSTTVDSLEKMGIAVKNARGEMLPLIQILQNVANSYGQLGQVQQTQVIQLTAGLRQGDLAKALFNDLSSGASKYAQALQFAVNSQGQAIQKNEELNQSLASLANKAKASGEALTSAIGERVIAPGLRNLLENVNNVFEQLNRVKGEGGVGANIGKGILDGIGTVLRGPGALLIIATLVGVFQKVGSFATKAIAELAGLDKAARQQASVEGQINTLLGERGGARQREFDALTTIAEKEQYVLRTIREENAALQQQQTIRAAVATGIINQGFIPVPGKAVPKPELPIKHAIEEKLPETFRDIFHGAGGYVPNVPASVKEFSDIQRGIGGATTTALPVTIPNFNFGGGHSGSIVANTSEYLVKNFAGGTGTAVFNPQMTQAIGGVTKLSSFGNIEKVAAQGYIPNFTDVFHGTVKDFTKFTKGDIGFHGGSRQAASERLLKIDENPGASFELAPKYLSRNIDFTGARVSKFNFDIKKPLRLKDVGDWSTPHNILDELESKKILSFNDAEQLRNKYSTIMDKRDLSYKDFSPIRNILKEKGFDGIVYQNSFEDRGQDSYIAFNPNQIKPSTFAKGFIPNYGSYGLLEGLQNLESRKGWMRQAEAPLEKTPYYEYGDAGVLANIISQGRNTAYLSSIQATMPGKGGASAFMRDLVRLAKENKTNIKLSAQPFGTKDFPKQINLDKLKGFYQKFGFESQGREKHSSGGQVRWQDMRLLHKNIVGENYLSEGFVPNYTSYINPDIDPFTIIIKSDNPGNQDQAFLSRSNTAVGNDFGRGDQTWKLTTTEIAKSGRSTIEETNTLEEMLPIIKKRYGKGAYDELFPKVEKLKGFGRLKQSEFGFTQPSYNPTVPRNLIDKLEGRRTNFAKELRGTILGGGNFLENVSQQIKTETGVDISKEEALKMVNFRLAQPSKNYSHWFSFTGRHGYGRSGRRNPNEQYFDPTHYNYVGNQRQGITVETGKEQRGYGHSFPYFHGFEGATEEAIKKATRFAAIESPEKNVFDIAPRVMDIRDKFYRAFQERDLTKGQGQFGTKLARSIRWTQHEHIRDSFFSPHFKEGAFSIKDKAGSNITIPSDILSLLGAPSTGYGSETNYNTERTVLQKRASDKIVSRVQSEDYPTNPEIKKALLTFRSLGGVGTYIHNKRPSEVLRKKEFIDAALYKIRQQNRSNLGPSITNLFDLPEHYNAITGGNRIQESLSDIIFRGKQIKEFFPTALEITNKEADNILRYAYEKKHDLYHDGASSIAKEYFFKDTPFFDKRHQIQDNRPIVDFLLKNKNSAQFTKERVAYGAAGQQRNFTYLDLVDRIRTEDLNQGAKSSIPRVFENVGRRVQLEAETEIEKRNAPFPAIPHLSKETDKVKRLKNEAALIEEGRAMGHCVGGYGDACRFSGRGGYDAYGRASAQLPLESGEFPKSIILSTGTATAELNPTLSRGGFETNFVRRFGPGHSGDFPSVQRAKTQGALTNALSELKGIKKNIAAHIAGQSPLDDFIGNKSTTFPPEIRQDIVKNLEEKRGNILKEYIDYRNARKGVINKYQIRGKNNTTPSEQDLEHFREYVRVNGLTPGFAEGFVPNYGISLGVLKNIFKDVQKRGVTISRGNTAQAFDMGMKAEIPKGTSGEIILHEIGHLFSDVHPTQIYGERNANAAALDLIKQHRGGPQDIESFKQLAKENIKNYKTNFLSKRLENLGIRQGNDFSQLLSQQIQESEIPSVRDTKSFKFYNKAAAHNLRLNIQYRGKENVTNLIKKLKTDKNFYRTTLGAEPFGSGFIPNFAFGFPNIPYERLGEGEFGLFAKYLRRPNLGFKLINPFLTRRNPIEAKSNIGIQNEISNEFKKAKEGYEVLKGDDIIGAPRVFGTLERSFARNRIGKEVASKDFRTFEKMFDKAGDKGKAELASQALTQMRRILSNRASSKYGLTLADNHFGNIAIQGDESKFLKLINTIISDKKFVTIPTHGHEPTLKISNEEIMNRLKKSKIKLSIIDFGHAHIEAPQFPNKVPMGSRPLFFGRRPETFFGSPETPKTDFDIKPFGVGGGNRGGRFIAPIAPIPRRRLLGEDLPDVSSGGFIPNYTLQGLRYKLENPNPELKGKIMEIMATKNPSAGNLSRLHGKEQDLEKPYRISMFYGGTERGHRSFDTIEDAVVEADYFKDNYVKFGYKLLDEKRIGLSRGFIPNFNNPLKEAIDRESKAVGRDKIYVDQAAQLQSPQNPLGLMVANKRDEPLGGHQGVMRAMAEGRNPKTYGAANGLIPNFAQFTPERLLKESDILQKHPKMFTLGMNSLDELTLDNLKALRAKTGREFKSSINEQEASEYSEQYGIFDNELKRRLKFINAPINVSMGLIPNFATELNGVPHKYIDELINSYDKLTPEQKEARDRYARSVATHLRIPYANELNGKRLLSIVSATIQRAGVPQLTQRPTVQDLQRKIQESPPRPTPSQAAGIAINFGDTTPISDEYFRLGGFVPSKARVEAQERQFKLTQFYQNERNKTLKDRLSLPIGRGPGQSFEKFESREARFLEEFKPNAFETQEIITPNRTVRREQSSQAKQNRLFGAAFLGPVVAEGLIGATGLTSDTRAGRAVQGVIGAASTGVTAGLLTGGNPLVGGLVGGFLALKAITDNLTKSLQDLDKEAQQRVDRGKEETRAITEAVRAFDVLKESSAGSPAAKQRGLRQFESAIQQVPPRFQPQFRESLKTGDREQIANIDFEAQLRQQRRQGAEKAASTFRKIQKEREPGTIDKTFFGLRNEFSTINRAFGDVDTGLGRVIKGDFGGFGQALFGKGGFSAQGVAAPLQLKQLTDKDKKQVEDAFSSISFKDIKNVKIPTGLQQQQDPLGAIKSLAEQSGLGKQHVNRLIDSLSKADVESLREISLSFATVAKESQKSAKEAESTQKNMQQMARFSELAGDILKDVAGNLHLENLKASGERQVGLTKAQGLLELQRPGLTPERLENLQFTNQTQSLQSGLTDQLNDVLTKSLGKLEIPPDVLQDRTGQKAIAEVVGKLQANPENITNILQELGTKIENIGNLKDQGVGRRVTEESGNIAREFQTVLQEHTNKEKQLNVEHEIALQKINLEQQRNFLGGDFSKLINFDFSTISRGANSLARGDRTDIASAFSSPLGRGVLGRQGAAIQGAGEELQKLGLFDNNNALRERFVQATIPGGIAQAINFTDRLERRFSKSPDIQNALEQSKVRIPEAIERQTRERFGALSPDQIVQQQKYNDLLNQQGADKLDPVKQNTTALFKSTEAINALISAIKDEEAPSPSASKASGGDENDEHPNAMARGFVPNFGAFINEMRDIKSGVGGARFGDKPYMTNISGIGSSVVNSGEAVIRNFLGSNKDAVFNRDMINAFGMPLNKLGNVQMAGGFIPNFQLMKLEDIGSSEPIMSAASQQADEATPQFNPHKVPLRYFNHTQRYFDPQRTSERIQASRGFIPNFGDAVDEIKKRNETIQDLLNEDGSGMQPSPTPNPPKENKSWWRKMLGLSGGYVPNFGDLESYGANLPTTLMKKLFGEKNKTLSERIKEYSLQTNDRIAFPTDKAIEMNLNKNTPVVFSRGFIPNFQDVITPTKQSEEEKKKLQQQNLFSILGGSSIVDYPEAPVQAARPGFGYGGYATNEPLTDTANIVQGAFNLSDRAAQSTRQERMNTIAQGEGYNSYQQLNRYVGGASVTQEAIESGAASITKAEGTPATDRAIAAGVFSSTRRKGTPATDALTSTGKFSLTRALGTPATDTAINSGTFRLNKSKDNFQFHTGFADRFNRFLDPQAPERTQTQQYQTQLQQYYNGRYNVNVSGGGEIPYPTTPVNLGIPSRYGTAGTVTGQQYGNLQQMIGTAGGPNAFSDTLWNKLLGIDRGQFDDAFAREIEYLQYRRGIPRHYAKGLVFSGYRPEVGVGVGNYLDEPIGRVNPDLGILQGITRVVKAGGNPRTAGGASRGYVPNFAANDELINSLKNLTNIITKQAETQNKQEVQKTTDNGGVNVDHNLNVSANVNVAGKVDSTNENVQQIVNDALASLKAELESKLNQIQNEGRYVPTPPQFQQGQ